MAQSKRQSSVPQSVFISKRRKIETELSETFNNLSNDGETLMSVERIPVAVLRMICQCLSSSGQELRGESSAALRKYRKTVLQWFQDIKVGRSIISKELARKLLIQFSPNSLRNLGLWKHITSSSSIPDYYVIPSSFSEGMFLYMLFYLLPYTNHLIIFNLISESESVTEEDTATITNESQGDIVNCGKLSNLFSTALCILDICPCNYT
jgi:hypothetical protein